MNRQRPSTSATSRQVLRDRIHEVIRQIPPGAVATYGQVALIAGASTPRLVGRALRELPSGSDVPWHRVLNSQGRVSPRGDGSGAPEQRQRLHAEGVAFDARGRVDFAAVAWSGPSWQWLEQMGLDLEDLVLRTGHHRRHGAWINWDL